MIKQDTETLQNILDRGTVDIVVKEDLKKKLQSGKKLRIKLGIDPTGSDLHIGHAVPLKKLKHFQNAGHQVIFLIGDYTAKIGDPTGKSETRPVLSDKEIQKNMKHYMDQASKVFDIEKAEIRYNSEWLAKLSMAEIIQITRTKTVSQILQRKDFKQRMQNEVDISLSEILYPIMQGYDSVALHADVEIGGTDQLFNLLTGRDLQRHYGQEEQNILTVPILEGLDGKEKMSKSLHNYIAIMDAPNDMYGKCMSIPDNLIMKYFELATDVPFGELKKLQQALNDGENPRNVKMKLAYELVSSYHTSEKAKEAEQYFITMFQKKDIPDDIPEITMEKKEYLLVNLIADLQLAPSKTEIRRMMTGGGIKIDGEKITDIDYVINIINPVVLQVGKKKIVKIV